MQCVGVEIVTACRACAAAVAVNGIVPTAPCPKCGRVITLGADFWRQVFAATMVQVARRSIGYEVTTSFASDGQSIRVVLRRANMPAGGPRRANSGGLGAD